MGKDLLNRLSLGCALIYFNPTRLWMRPLGFFMLEKGDPLCGVVEPGKSSVGKSCSDGGGLEEEAIRINGRSSVCDLGGLESMSGIRFLLPFICSTVKRLSALRAGVGEEKWRLAESTRPLWRAAGRSIGVLWVCRAALAVNLRRGHLRRWPSVERQVG
ncbi:hypothetical protein SADUNF_Sadunf09G0005900 [Salix dunnii]|uniref:Uncharacterized protein n=1 Tax=Salix dunnii TaxID=1413687 RepID=A0A835MRP0_9ROSI|nr:hypothetical protein SADUNF_Sadunf09G0005900 [Salix dunnii]